MDLPPPGKPPSGHGEIVRSRFRPAWWCRGPHAQTNWPYWARRFSPRPRYRRERIELPDGDFLDLDWSTMESGKTGESGESGPLALIVHGLEGGSESHYTRGLVQGLTEQGWRAVVMHLRGCSGEPNRLPRRYHSGETGDLRHVLELLSARASGTPLVAVGYSLGGNALLKLLGESGDSGEPLGLQMAVTVSVPYDLARAARRMERGLSRMYQTHLVRQLRRATYLKRELMPAKIDIEHLPALKTFYEFDDYVTAPLHGFQGADDYYAQSSSRQYLRQITTPTVLLHALDDPFMTPDVVPSAAELSPAVRLELSPQGGHVGFVEGVLPGRARYWLDTRVPQILNVALQETRQTD